ncbi:MAG: DUF1501 domain-containing protein [Planctomycetes bacterium]|nr:DUF1501 domain-containing protein [Planctomycetota bacterium]
MSRRRATAFDRRSLLGWSGATALGLLGSLGAPAPLFARARAAGTGGPGDRKLLTIFLRGGNDALNTIVPLHDADYLAPTTRPTLALAPNQCLDLGNGAAAFHPALAKLKTVYDLGSVAAIQRVGYPAPTLSHFSGQQFVETAKPGDYAFREGWTARWAAQSAPGGSALSAVSVSPQLMMQFSGAKVLPHVPSLAEYSTGGDPASVKLFGDATSGLFARYAAPTTGAHFDPLVHATGDALGASLAELATLPAYTPLDGSFPTSLSELVSHGLPAADWALGFFSELRDAVHVLKHSAATIVGVEIPGFDTHAAQGTLAGPHADRLAVLAHALRALWYETELDLWPDLVCVVQSEFGRTSAENGSAGTDHGHAGAALVVGGPVQGGVHHCDPTSWPSGATLFETDGRYVEHSTDFRAVLAEILERHLLLTPPELDLVIPGWSSLAGPTFAPLGVLA